MEFANIELKPLSWQILSHIYDKEPKKAQEIADELGLGTRQVDAAVTKTLVRFGFCIREAKITRLMKKEYNLIKITDKGNRYVKWRLENDSLGNRGA